ncbi:MAG: helix-turn-helix transcriptional regulator [Pseudomonadota bacterium]
MATLETLFEVEIQDKLREALKRHRKAANLSQRSLARELGQAHSFVNKVESGGQRLDVSQFIRWCYCCSASPADVMREVSD